MASFSVQNTFSDSLPGDKDTSNQRRQVFDAAYSFVEPKGSDAPELLLLSTDLAQKLGFSEEFCQSTSFLDIVSGNALPTDSKPFAMCYGGHQFGHWANQLGDGRAINLGEIPTKTGPQNIQLKGAGPTPYSRSADGFAVLRSSIREFLCSEAMHHLGVPTTRALSLVLTGEQVWRDKMYDGNADYEPGAIVSRVSESFIRFGNFEIFAARKDLINLQKLADYTIATYYNHLADTENKYLSFFNEVSEKTCDMIVHWQRVGFVHGVMNTDNMSILGQTIDYGPYGWLDAYDPNWTPNTTDLPGKRYRFGNQPVIAQWNLIKLANALYPLIKDADALTQVMNDFQDLYESKYHLMMQSKLGLQDDHGIDAELISGLEELLTATEIDMTMFFRLLSRIHSDIDVQEAISLLLPAFYTNPLPDEIQTKWHSWILQYTERLSLEKKSNEDRIQNMLSVNPKYTLRNYMAQMAIDAAEKGDYSILNELNNLILKPYEEQEEYQKWFAKRPDWARVKIGCSMLSCSS